MSHKFVAVTEFRRLDCGCKTRMISQVKNTIGEASAELARHKSVFDRNRDVYKSVSQTIEVYNTDKNNELISVISSVGDEYEDKT